ncbi:MAG: hypothetical protein ACYCVL_10155 [Gemmatimonadaceae bacterium]|jgi:hypothetical protein|nr:hypothetical protein [Gemmatimonadaceae bacterium]
MRRALTVQRTLIPPQDRKRYADRLARRKEYYAKANCHFWAFEEEALPGAFLEFFEAPDVETLTRAHAGAPDPILDAGRIYIEVELP